MATTLGEPRLLDAAQREARLFYPLWLEMNSPREIAFKFGEEISAERIDAFDQIAYTVRPMVLGCLNLAEALNDTNLAWQAGELAAWFFGRNPMHQQMYDPETGRCFDGVLVADKLNRNAGAESTIEALYTVLEVEANPVARRALTAWRQANRNRVRPAAAIGQATIREKEIRQ